MADLKTFRAANNIKQKDLSAYLNVTAPYLSQIEAGIRPLSKSLIEKIAENPYDWDLSYLYKERPSESPSPSLSQAKASKAEVANIVAAYEKSERLIVELNKKNFAIQTENDRLKE